MPVPKKQRPRKTSVRKHKRNINTRTRPVVPTVKIPGMKTRIVPEGDIIEVNRTPTTINIGRIPRKPIVRRKK